MTIALALIVFAAPLQAASSKAVGILSLEGKVYLGADLTTETSAVYPGDKIRTDDGRATFKLTGGDLLVLDRNSEVSLPASSEGLVIGLEKGQIVWRTSSTKGIQVDTDGLTLKPTGSIPSLASIALMNDGSVVVAVERGSFAAANFRQDPVVVTAGNVLTVAGRVEGGPGAGAKGGKSAGGKLRSFHIGTLSHAASAAVVVGGIGAGVGTGVYFAVRSTSPSTPY